MIRRSDFKKLKKPPKNYIPAISRGDTGFVTKLNIGPMNEKI